MATTYLTIAAKIEKLQAQATRLRNKERAGVIARIKEAIDAYGITADDLGLVPHGGLSPKRERKSTERSQKIGKKTRATSVAKFRDAAGNTWGGRGPRPVWLRNALADGATLESFLI